MQDSSDPYAAVRAAQRDADAAKRERMVMWELRNALARAVKQADRDQLVAPVVTLRVKG